MTITVSRLHRHPIKSHGVEVLDAVTLLQGKCIPWDRKYAVLHEAGVFSESDPEWAHCVNFSRGAKAPELMAIKASVDEAAGTIHLTHPKLGDLTINPEIAADAERLLEWTRSIMPPNRASSVKLVSAPDRGMTDTDFASVSLNSTSSLKSLSEKAEADLSPLRFRGNIWVDGAEPWDEFNWIGKEVQIGETRLFVREPIGRCLATTANPETGERDVNTLAALKEGWGHQDFGVYAKVLQGGQVRPGDKLVVL